MAARCCAGLALKKVTIAVVSVTERGGTAKKTHVHRQSALHRRGMHIRRNTA